MKREAWKHFDFWLFGTVVILCIFGIAMIRSAVAGNEVLGDLVSRQMIWTGVTIGVILVVGLVDYHFYAALSRPLYLGTAILLAIIFLVGKVSFGAKRWLDTGFFFIQPAELAKVLMILILADFFARHRDEEKNLRWVARSFILTASVVIWILLQPNLSNSIVIFVLWFALLWLSGLPTRYLAIFGLVVIVLGAAAFPFLEQYQQQRILDFVIKDPNARHGNSCGPGVGDDRLRGVDWPGIWTQHPGAAALSESAAHRFYFFGDGGRIWFCRHHFNYQPAGFCDFSLLQGCPAGERRLWSLHSVWVWCIAFLPDCG
jgi:rod shape determining protein RodA